MEEQDLLSKKDLLAFTGISYGQLYRWKRQNLIPESWFIKQSSYTGQETFFPKEKVLKRVEAILKLKDQYSLEELAEIFTPELTQKVFKASSLHRLEGLNQAILDLYIQRSDHENLTFRELLFIYALSKIEQTLNFGESWRSYMVASAIRWQSQVANSDYQMLVCQIKGQKFSLLLQEGSALLLDNDSEVLADIKLNELANELGNKINAWEELE
ncbi:hypothetical protein Desor_4135 [Desulfosporosinus orientis DSM 765]|uniref:DUF4004 domain-containing protein n=1 Tax=Desulfosporosinus orientis (strain ATCC 19365 / DSM 765 / NCIMB 8382 / VKM B-1628 / Singapore I) TaxID=768706 RepID=G7WH64_DESOD|nr:DUF4004 family protein [Desulfosporosinus orientis]AET69572.1 hypothetical protein Desor_4135 [Desulfosporosinus orientis DSM 765]